ncbi:MAG: NADH-quinone oxidoreductase subunit E/F, partial [Bdellovibrionaceae bacterium]|nr:NADH-quinone oxidoreductase subunit E/F [Pseudobdellovibrionaceae bacterium]
IGYMLFGFSLGTKAAMMAAVFYVVHHILVKTNLFLLGGLICQVGGTFELKKTGGIARHYPFLAAVFFIPAFSLAGFPLLSGFFAKFSLLKAGFEQEAFVLLAIALVVSVLTLISMLKIWTEAFWKPVPLGSNAPPYRSLSWGQLAPVIMMAAGTLILGIWPQLLLSPAERIASELKGRTVYIEAVLGGPK